MVSSDKYSRPRGSGYSCMQIKVDSQYCPIENNSLIGESLNPKIETTLSKKCSLNSFYTTEVLIL